MRLALLLVLLFSSLASAKTETVHLTWTVSQDSGIIAMRIYQDTSSNMVQEIDGSSGTTEFTVDIVGCSNFWARYVTAQGESPYNSEVVPVCQSADEDPIPAQQPIRVEGLTGDKVSSVQPPVGVHNKAYAFSWSANAEPVEGYKLYYKKGGDPFPPSTGMTLPLGHPLLS